MDKPTGTKTLDLQPAALPNNLCEMAKGGYNSARRGKLAYQALTFILAVFLVVAIIYAVISFNDDEQARGFLGLVTAAGTFATSGFLALLAKDAKQDEEAMWERVEGACGGGGGAGAGAGATGAGAGAGVGAGAAGV